MGSKCRYGQEGLANGQKIIIDTSTILNNCRGIFFMPNICKINKRGWWILVMNKCQRLPKKESQVPLEYKISL